MTTPYSVKLNANDMALAELVALTRNERYGSGSGREFSGKSSLDIHRVGAYGEVAFAKLVGYPVDISWGRADEGVDFWVSDSQGEDVGIGVKCRDLRGQPNDLMIRAGGHYVSADIIVLMEWQRARRRDNIVDFVGWATRDDVLTHPGRIRIRGQWVDRYIVPRATLRPLEDMTKHLMAPDIEGVKNVFRTARELQQARLQN